jgi:hypothetical protein
MWECRPSIGYCRKTRFSVQNYTGYKVNFGGIRTRAVGCEQGYQRGLRDEGYCGYKLLVRSTSKQNCVQRKFFAEPQGSWRPWSLGSPGPVAMENGNQESRRVRESDRNVEKLE